MSHLHCILRSEATMVHMLHKYLNSIHMNAQEMQGIGSAGNRKKKGAHNKCYMDTIHTVEANTSMTLLYGRLRSGIMTLQSRILEVYQNSW